MVREERAKHADTLASMEAVYLRDTAKLRAALKMCITLGLSYGTGDEVSYSSLEDSLVGSSLVGSSLVGGGGSSRRGGEGGGEGGGGEGGGGEGGGSGSGGGGRVDGTVSVQLSELA